MKIVLLFNSLVLVLLFSLAAASQRVLEDKRVTIQMEGVAFGKVLEVLIEKYDVPFGFEHPTESLLDYAFDPNVRYGLKANDENVLILKPGKHPISVNFDQAKLSDVMDRIVTQMPDYKWEIRDGVVNIFPAKNRDELFRKLLDLKVASFKVTEQRYIFMVENELLKMPELSKFLQDNEACIRNLGALNPYHSKRELTEDLRFSDLTIKELLNRITKIKRGGWILQRIRYSNGKECISIRI